MMHPSTFEPQRYIPIFGLSGLGFQLQGALINSPFKVSSSLSSSGNSDLSSSSPQSESGLATPTLSSSPSLDTTQEIIDLENGPSRYVAYAMRLKTVIVASSRYVAYSSDIGEAFRPLTRPGFVTGAYAISWTYILGDVIYAGYKAAKQYEALASTTFTTSSGPLEEFETEAAKYAHKALSSAKENLPLEKLLDPKTLSALSPTEKVELRKRHTQRLAQQGEHAGVDPNQVSEAMHVGLTMARRGVFQSIASMALPAFTIHSIVRYSAPLFAKAKSTRIKAAGPTVAGLMFVPAMPFLFDEPVEHVVDFAFDWIQERLLGGSKAADRVVEAAKEKVL
ncbi:uncharacterized protein MEPE_06092 [Melanopsichium pennsylvanicum]|uniref:Mitochondrial fission process protein 1 n=2 Tax=Melanopsichium pennsylvanicum TaxID=63383 RepID=A0AAJ4XS41_9BASI|nr:conserved hypothetical protein [Melanopsichium pennsylvanicum 4]SNX87382.1 uncharacterized protein MEPE_06092 [Melanopsichium pennsylvanicum]